MNMSQFKYKLGLGLAGRIMRYIKYYKGDITTFDYTKVFIVVKVFNNKTSFYVRCYCRDTLAQGLSNIPYITIYESKKYKSLIEAEAKIEREIRFSIKKLKESEFYLYKPVDHYENGKLIDDVWGNFIYDNFKWKLIDELPLKEWY